MQKRKKKKLSKKIVSNIMIVIMMMIQSVNALVADAGFMKKTTIYMLIIVGKVMY